MTNTSGSLKRAETAREILNQSAKVRSHVQANTSSLDKIKENPFYKILFSPELSEEQRPDALAKELTFTESREENREKVEAFNALKAYLQTVREQMHSEVIRLSDPQNFAVLRTVMDEMNTALINFETEIKPLTDILDALHLLREENLTMDAFREIQDEGKRREAQEAELAEIDKAIKSIESEISTFNTDIRLLNDKRKSFLFFKGDVTDEAKREIAQKETLIEERLADLNKMAEKATEVRTRDHEKSKMSGELISAKEKLRQLLAVGNDEHENQTRKMIQTALHFIETTKAKTDQVHTQLGNMDKQIRQVSDNNDKMSTLFAILNEGVGGAEKNNREIREKLLAEGESENAVKKLQQTQMKRDLDEHIKMLEMTNMDTKSTLADLTTSSIRIKNMKDSNEGQIHMVTELRTRGVANIAERLSTVVTAVSSAAINEANLITNDTLRAMSAHTDRITQSESLRIAMGIGERALSIGNAIDDLIHFGQTQQEATEWTHNAMAQLRENMAILEEKTKFVSESVEASRSVVADVVTSTSATSEKKTDSKPSDDPFGF